MQRRRKNYPSILLSFTITHIHLHGVVHIQGQEASDRFFFFGAICLFLLFFFSGITDIGEYWYYLPKPKERATNKKKGNVVAVVVFVAVIIYVERYKYTLNV
jgi:hypothetical protein